MENLSEAKDTRLASLHARYVTNQNLERFGLSTKDVNPCSRCGHKTGVQIVGVDQETTKFDTYFRIYCYTCGNQVRDPSLKVTVQEWNKSNPLEDTERDTFVSDFSRLLEDGVRDTVMALRVNGINTTSSCHHSGTIEALSYNPTLERRIIWDTLHTLGVKTFKAVLNVEVTENFTCDTWVITSDQFKEKTK